MKHQNIFLIILSGIVILNTIIIAALLLRTPNTPNSTNSNVTAGLNPDTPTIQGPPEIISFADEDRAVGALEQVAGDSLVISRYADTPEDKVEYTVTTNSSTIITDNMSTELELLRSSTQYKLTDIPLDSIILAQCESITNNVCSASIVQFQRSTIPDNFNPNQSSE